MLATKEQKPLTIPAEIYADGFTFSETLVSVPVSASVSTFSNTCVISETHNGDFRTVTEDPFGNIIRQTGPAADDNPFRFSTHYHDDETVLIYAKNRYYDPELGRFLSRDPIHELGFRVQHRKRRVRRDYNLYRYVQNDPVSKCDPFGLVTMRDWWFNKACWKCGPDVTDGLKASKRNVEQRFRDLEQNDPDQIDDNCDPFFALPSSDPIFAAGGWDLASLVWADPGPRVRGSDGISVCPFGRKCSESVTVNGKCYWKWSVNYSLFGWMGKLCGASKAQMQATIVAWKSQKPFDWPQVDNALDFANAGYDGFPDSGSVAADNRYKDCKPCEEHTYCTSGLGSSWPGSGGRDRRGR